MKHGVLQPKFSMLLAEHIEQIISVHYFVCQAVYGQTLSSIFINVICQTSYIKLKTKKSPVEK